MGREETSRGLEGSFTLNGPSRGLEAFSAEGGVQGGLKGA